MSLLPALLPALLPLPCAAEPAPLERVEITGSAIRRVAGQGPAPLEIITRRDIERSGARSLNELAASIPLLDLFDQGEQGAGSPTGSGVAHVRLRGLDETNVLVLLNGHRLPVNPLADTSGAGAAVDLNLIPLAAIERIEILKDGASALYGSDAVAGVVNLITRRSGRELSLGAGISSRGDARERSASLSGGLGDAAQDGWQLQLGLDLYRRDPLPASRRDNSRSADFRRLGGADQRSIFTPGGNVVDPVSGAAVGLPYRACAPADLDASSNCRYDYNQSLLNAYNGADRVGLHARLGIEPDARTRASAELLYSRSVDHFSAHPAPDYFLLPITDAAQSAFDADPSQPGSVFVAGRFVQGGPRLSERRASLLHGVLGLESGQGTTDWQIHLGYGLSRVDLRESGVYHQTLWNQALADGSLDPSRSDNPQAVVDALRISPQRQGRLGLLTLDARLGSDLLQLPAGPLRQSSGVSLWREALSDRPDALSRAGLVVGSVGQSGIEASRTVQALYTELQWPISERLEAQLALRHDRYPDAHATSPKLALRYAASPTLLLRATQAQSLRMPQLKQLHGNQEQSALNMTLDAASCQRLGLGSSCDITGLQLSGSNSALQPEHGRSLSLGLSAELGRHSSVDLDLWRIDKRDEIVMLTPAEAIARGQFSRNAGQWLVSTPLQNIARSQSSGVDLEWRSVWPTAFGRLQLRNQSTWYQHLRRSAADQSQLLVEYASSYRYPRWRNQLGAELEQGAWSWGASLRSVSGFRDSDQPLTITADTPRVSSWHEVDLQLRLRSDSGWIWRAGIHNLFDRMPPFSQTNANSSLYSQFGFAELYGNRGRYFHATASYRF